LGGGGRKMKFYEICGVDIVAVFSLGLLIFWNILKFIKNFNSSLDKYKNE
jgi:hypothetical protein